MAVTMKNCTLDGEAIRVKAYRDHVGKAQFDIEILDKFGCKTLNAQELFAFAEALLADVFEAGGLLSTEYGTRKFSNGTLAEFTKPDADVAREEAWHSAASCT